MSQDHPKLLSEHSHMKCRKFIFPPLLALTLTLIVAIPASADLFSGKTKPPAELSGQEPDFLPVDEAYKFSSRVAGYQLIIRWDIADGYYLYKDRMKIAIAETNVEAGEPQWSKPGKDKQDEYFGLVKAFYQDVEAIIPIIKAPDGEVTITITYQGCAEAGLCYPPQQKQALYIGKGSDEGSPLAGQTSDGASASLATDVNANADTTQIISAQPASNFSKQVSAEGGSSAIPDHGVFAESGLWLALVFAFTGGLILNLMPCVFPVLSLKAIKLAQAQTRDHRQNKSQALAYTAGVVTLFTGIALLMVVLRASGEHIGWGFQLQTPWFVGLMVYVLFVLGLCLLGWLEPGARMMGFGNDLTHSGGKRGAFFSGALAVVVASPCTAPFMGSALGYAVTLPNSQALLIFIALGLGMAFPFLLLGFLPALARLLPKPGPWMETFKQMLAFPMFLSALWLLWVLGRQTSVEGMAMVLSGLIAIVFSIWLFKYASHKMRMTRHVALGMAVISLGFSAWALNYQNYQTAAKHEITASATNKIYFEFDPNRLSDWQTSGKPVFVNVTADWCVSCLVNEQTVLSNDPVAALLASEDVIYVKGDWTNDNPVITSYLASFGRNGVPLYVVYQPGEPPKVLSQILSTEEVLSALIPAANNSHLSMN